jgi:hypothetical protein
MRNPERKECRRDGCDAERYPGIPMEMHLAVKHDLDGVTVDG